MEDFSWITPPDQAGKRLDRLVRELKPGYSRSRIKKLFASGAILYNDRVASPALRSLAGKTLTLKLPADASPLAPPELEVLYQDRVLLAVDKPSGIPSHPLRLNEGGTALDGMILIAPEVGCADSEKLSEEDRQILGGSPSGQRGVLEPGRQMIGDGLQHKQKKETRNHASEFNGRDRLKNRWALEGGLAHRLDNPTSGVLIAAKGAENWAALQAAFAGPEAYKEYLAIATGRIEGDRVIEFPIGHAARDAKRSHAVFPPGWEIPAGAKRVRGRVRGEARPARTEVSPLAWADGYSLVLVRVKKALTHQVRIHLAAIGHPLSGDERYLPEAWEVPPASRLALHASRVVFLHPIKKTPCVIESPLPEDLKEFWRGLASGTTPCPGRGPKADRP